MSNKWSDPIFIDKIIEEHKNEAEEMINICKKLTENFKIKSTNFELDKIAEIQSNFLKKLTDNVDRKRRLQSDYCYLINEMDELSEKEDYLNKELHKLSKLLEDKKDTYRKAKKIFKLSEQLYFENLDLEISIKDKSGEKAIVTFNSHKNFVLEFDIKGKDVVGFNPGKLELDPGKKQEFDTIIESGRAPLVLSKLRNLIISNSV